MFASMEEGLLSTMMTIFRFSSMLLLMNIDFLKRAIKHLIILTDLINHRSERQLRFLCQKRECKPYED